MHHVDYTLHFRVVSGEIVVQGCRIDKNVGRVSDVMCVTWQ